MTDKSGRGFIIANILSIMDLSLRNLYTEHDLSSHKYAETNRQFVRLDSTCIRLILGTMKINGLIIIFLAAGILLWAGCDDDETIANDIDTERPAVEITEPINGAYIQTPDNVVIKANATDNVRVSRVDFYIDGKLFVSDQISPYTASWNINKLTSARSFTLFARAFDPSNNTNVSQDITVYVIN